MERGIKWTLIIFALLALIGSVLFFIFPEIRFNLFGDITPKLCQKYYPLETDFNQCVYNFAGREGNEKLCEQLGSLATSLDKEKCYSYAYSSTGQVSLCYNLPSLKSECIMRIALNTRNSELCEEAGLYAPEESSKALVKLCNDEISCRLSSDNDPVKFNTCLEEKLSQK